MHSAVFCHLPSFEALGLDMKAHVSLGLSNAASSLLVGMVKWGMGSCGSMCYGRVASIGARFWVRLGCARYEGRCVTWIEHRSVFTPGGCGDVCVCVGGGCFMCQG